jgi:hypothetical protein
MQEMTARPSTPRESAGQYLCKSSALGFLSQSGAVATAGGLMGDSAARAAVSDATPAITAIAPARMIDLPDLTPMDLPDRQLAKGIGVEHPSLVRHRDRRR